ncbi:MAG: efflux RND transporter periplasmic adaptor subunit [Rubripirellula sp.]
MTDRQRTVNDRPSGDKFWDECQRLIDRIETVAKQSPRREPLTSGQTNSHLYQRIASDLLATIGADAVRIRACHDGDWTTLADQGLALFHHAENAAQTIDASESIVASAPLADNDMLDIEVRFGNPIPFPRRAPVEQLLAVLADLAAPIELRNRVEHLRSRLDQQSDRDRFIADLHRGDRLPETLAAIATASADAVSIDRVSLMRYRAGRYQMVASSASPSIDRRSDHVRSLQRLAERCLSDSSRFAFAIGAGPPNDASTADEVLRYMDEAGCREIHFETIIDPESQSTVAAVVLERFQCPLDAPEHLGDAWNPVRAPVGSAVRAAIDRQASLLPSAVRHLISADGRRVRIAVAIGFLGLALLGWIPVPFDISAEGRVTAMNQSRIYSPAEAVVSDVLVSDGDTVTAGQPLVILRSPDLDLRYQSLASAMETAKAKLASLSARRGVTRDSQMSADEQVLEAEIAGLDRQIAAIKRQLDGLTLTSPIDGTVDQWDMAGVLASRPVSHGQYLISVVSKSDGWNAELEIADQSIAYVIESQSQRPTPCSLKLRSSPTNVLHGQVDRISDVADLNLAGQSVVKVRVPIEVDADSAMRQGATVVAKLHCGRRAAGFVYLRSVIQWYRQLSWF